MKKKQKVGWLEFKVPFQHTYSDEYTDEKTKSHRQR